MPGCGIQQTRRRAALLPERLRGVAKIVVVDAVGDFGPERGLGDVRIDIDDEIVGQLARAFAAWASTSRVSEWMVIFASSRTAGAQ